MRRAGLETERKTSVSDVVSAADRAAEQLIVDRLPDDGVREPLLRVLREAATVRMLGSGSIELASVAGGRLGAWVQYDSLDWDWLPGAAMVRAAGGATHVTELGGHRWHIAGSHQV